MGAPKLTPDEFIHEFNLLGPHGMARKHDMGVRNIYRRRRSLEGAGYKIEGPKDNPVYPKRASYAHRANLSITEGTAIVFGDAHYRPREASLLHRAAVALCKDLKPRAVICNGDVIDAPTISRHPPIGWESRPKLADEIEAAKERLHEIEKTAFKAEKIWNLGNHDARFETRIATVAPEYAQIHGVHLKDHFPLWQSAWSTWINDEVVIKHRFKGGIHATHNNTLWSGKTIVTGHLHSAKVTPFSDYNGTRYGVDTGCIADVDAQTFVDYTEDNPKNWRSAFCVLTFKEGRLLQPELVVRWDDDHVQFRGEIIAP